MFSIELRHRPSCSTPSSPSPRGSHVAAGPNQQGKGAAERAGEICALRRIKRTSVRVNRTESSPFERHGSRARGVHRPSQSFGPSHARPGRYSPTTTMAAAAAVIAAVAAGSTKAMAAAVPARLWPQDEEAAREHRPLGQAAPRQYRQRPPRELSGCAGALWNLTYS